MASVACHVNKGVCSPSGRGDLWGQAQPPRPKASILIHRHISTLGWRNLRRKKRKKTTFITIHSTLQYGHLSPNREYENTRYRLIHYSLIFNWTNSESEVTDMSRSRAQDEIQDPTLENFDFSFKKMLQIAP